MYPRVNQPKQRWNWSSVDHFQEKPMDFPNLRCQLVELQPPQPTGLRFGATEMVGQNLWSCYISRGETHICPLFWCENPTTVLTHTISKFNECPWRSPCGPTCKVTENPRRKWAVFKTLSRPFLLVGWQGQPGRWITPQVIHKNVGVTWFQSMVHAHSPYWNADTWG